MPPRTRRGIQNTPRFLFVNQDAASVVGNTTDPILIQTKQSHVQRQHFVRKRQAQLKRLNPAVPGPSVRQNSVRADFDECNTGAPVEHEQFNSTDTPVPSRHAASTERCQSKNAQNDILEYSEDAGFRHKAASSSTHFSHYLYATNNEVPRPRPQYALDPFTGTTLALHPAAPILIQYYTETMIPRIFAVDKRAANGSERRHLHAFQKDMN